MSVTIILTVDIHSFVAKEGILKTISRTNVASVGSVFNDTREVKVLSKTRVVFPDPPLLTPNEGPSLETSIFPLSCQ